MTHALPLGILLLLSACSTSVVKPVPEALLVPQKVEDYKGTRYKDVVKQAAVWHQQLLSCETDRAAIAETQK